MLFRKCAVWFVAGVVTVAGGIACHDEGATPPAVELSQRASTAQAYSPGGESYGINVTNLFHGGCPPHASRGSYAFDEALRLARLARHSGVGWARMAVYKCSYDLAHPPYSNPSISESIRTAEALDSMGLKIFATLAWDLANVPDDATWTAFVTWAVDAHPWVNHWGIWNEANCTSYWPSTVPIERYDTLAQLAYPIIHGAGKKMVLGEAAHAPDWNAGRDAAGCEGYEWLINRVTAANENYDIVSIHAYGSASAARSQASYYANFIGGHKPIWVTETGYSSETADAAQASFVGTVLDEMRSVGSGPYDKVFIFSLYAAYDGHRIAHWSPGYESAMAPITPRPAYSTMIDRVCDGTRCAPIAQWHSTSNGAHFYSRDSSEVGAPYWIKDLNRTFFVQAADDPDDHLEPLLECWAFAAHRMWRGITTCPSGYSDPKILGYLSPDSLPGTKRLRLLYRASDTDYFATPCFSEYSGALSSGYSLVETLGFVWTGRCTWG